jgi:hypothetical protein
MSDRLYIAAEDRKLHRLGCGALLLCGKVMVTQASETQAETREMCEECENAES